MLMTKCWTLRGFGVDPIKGDVYLSAEDAERAKEVIQASNPGHLELTTAEHRLVLGFGGTDEQVTSEALLVALGIPAKLPSPVSEPPDPLAETQDCEKCGLGLKECVELSDGKECAFGEGTP